MFYRTALAALTGLTLSQAAIAADTSIDQVGQKFSTTTVTLKAGESIHFLNKDDVTHNINVIDSDDNANDKGLQKPGETIDQKFDKPGDFQVRCSIHPKMKMTVKVQ
jgi:plastocyanin